MIREEPHDTTGAGSGRRRRLVWYLGMPAIIAAFCWLSPPFSFRSRATVERARAGARFDAKEFVERFWNEQLATSHERAADAAAVLHAFAADPAKARENFGRTVGISSTVAFYLRGTGRVVSATDQAIGLAVASTGNAADIVVPLGLVFGNAVRDGTGLLDSSAFPNAQQFNDIAAGLNLLVETEVLPALQRIAAIGRRVEFVGCAEVDGDARDPRPLHLVPVFVRDVQDP